MPTIELLKINLTPGMRSGQRFAWSGVLEPGTGVLGVPSGLPVALVFYSLAKLQGWPDSYDPSAEKLGGWAFDILDARGVALVRGAGLSVGIDLLWSYHAYAGVPPGKLIVWTPTGADPTLADFVDGAVEVYYQPHDSVDAQSGTDGPREGPRP
jgi:hypothetical protein